METPVIYKGYEIKPAKSPGGTAAKGGKGSKDSKTLTSMHIVQGTKTVKSIRFKKESEPEKDKAIKAAMDWIDAKTAK